MNHLPQGVKVDDWHTDSDEDDEPRDAKYNTYTYIPADPCKPIYVIPYRYGDIRDAWEALGTKDCEVYGCTLKPRSKEIQCTIICKDNAQPNWLMNSKLNLWSTGMLQCRGDVVIHSEGNII